MARLRVEQLQQNCTTDWTELVSPLYTVAQSKGVVFMKLMRKCVCEWSVNVCLSFLNKV